MNMDSLKKAVNIVKESFNIVAFTGAGVSTESNIPDFRSANGLYSNKKKYKYPPEHIISHSFFMDHTEEFYDYYRNNMVYMDAKPNKCHIALAELEKAGRIKAVITQNIDGLHQAAGSRNVLELHGSVNRNYCMKCKKKFDLEYVMDMSKPIPLCDECGGIVRPDVVLYEEQLDYNILDKSVSYIRSADVLMILGTSLVVYPAAGLVDYYKGDKLILINKSSTPYDYRAQVIINDKCGKIMSRIADKVLNSSGE